MSDLPNPSRFIVVDLSQTTSTGTLAPWLEQQQEHSVVCFDIECATAARELIESCGLSSTPVSIELNTLTQVNSSISLLPISCDSFSDLLLQAAQKALESGQQLLTLAQPQKVPHCANPDIVPEAITLKEITFEEALEILPLSSATLSRAALHQLDELEIELIIADVSSPDGARTHVRRHTETSEYGVRALVSRSSVALLSVQYSERHRFAPIFEALEQAGIEIVFASNAVADTTLTLAIDEVAVEKARAILPDQLETSIEVSHGYCAIAVVGATMRNRSGVSGKVFETLGRNGVSVAAIAQSASELSISVIVQQRDLSKAMRCLHDSLFLSSKSHLHMMIVGPGSIGSELLTQVETYASEPSASRSSISVVGIANSRDTLFDPRGISLERWKSRSSSAAEPISLEKALSTFTALNLPNSVLVDCTASEDLPALYATILSQSISVVTPNKRGLCGSYPSYKTRIETARRHNAKWYYETTVGAGLPIIGTIHDLLASGDEIIRIEAVLSGTLSYLFNNYTGACSFAELVRSAQAEGYTEPDPRDDLNGLDVARKLLILAREAGHAIELADIAVRPPVPTECLETGSVEEFYELLLESEPELSTLLSNATTVKKRLRYIATLGEAKDYEVALTEVGAAHPFYDLSGTDNILAITTKRYRTQPLVIRGPGAGVSVTAAGVFADILRVASFLE